MNQLSIVFCLLLSLSIEPALASPAKPTVSVSFELKEDRYRKKYAGPKKAGREGEVVAVFVEALRHDFPYLGFVPAPERASHRLLIRLDSETVGEGRERAVFFTVELAGKGRTYRLPYRPEELWDLSPPEWPVFVRDVQRLLTPGKPYRKTHFGGIQRQVLSPIRLSESDVAILREGEELGWVVLSYDGCQLCLGTSSRLALAHWIPQKHHRQRRLIEAEYLGPYFVEPRQDEPVAEPGLPADRPADRPEGGSSNAGEMNAGEMIDKLWLVQRDNPASVIEKIRRQLAPRDVTEIYITDYQRLDTGCGFLGARTSEPTAPDEVEFDNEASSVDAPDPMAPDRRCL